MAETVYDVKVRYMTDDRASKGLRTIGQEAERASRSSGSLTKTLMGIGAGVAAWKGFSLGKSLLIDFNSQMEQSAITMGGLMMMNMGGDWASNQERANKLMAQFQEDAKSSVATTADFANVASGIVAPLTQVGGTMEDIRKITQGVVVASGAFGMSGEVAARDIEQALAGRMGVADRLPKLLGLDPESWNKMIAKNPAKAIPELLKVLQQPAIKQMAEAQANTFAGQWSTLKDNMQIALGKVGLPLMKELGKEFAHVAAWMDKNPERINEIARSIASALVKGFGAVKSAMTFLYDNRETILMLAKAFIAFKAVNYAVSGITSLAGSMTSLTSTTAGAAKGMTGFTSNLAGVTAGLAGLATLAGESMIVGPINDLIQEMEQTEQASFQSDRARVLGGAKVDAFDPNRMRMLEAQALKMGYTDDAGAKMYAGATGRNRGIFSAGDKMIGKGVLQELVSAKGLKGGAGAAGKLTLGDVAKMQGINTGNHGSIQQLLGLAKEKGFTGNTGTLMQMGPDELVALIGADVGKMWTSLGDTRDGDQFITALMGVSNALKMHAGIIQEFEFASMVDELATSAADIGASVASMATGLVDSLWGTSPPKGVKGDRSTNVTIRKIEVVSDDPDRFAMNLVGAFQDYNKSPTQAVNAINER